MLFHLGEIRSEKRARKTKRGECKKSGNRAGDKEYTQIEACQEETT